MDKGICYSYFPKFIFPTQFYLLFPLVSKKLFSNFYTKCDLIEENEWDFVKCNIKAYRRLCKF